MAKKLIFDQIKEAEVKFKARTLSTAAEKFIVATKKLFSHTISFIDYLDFEDIVDDNSLEITPVVESSLQNNPRFNSFRYRELFNTRLIGSNEGLLGDYIEKQSIPREIRPSMVMFDSDGDWRWSVERQCSTPLNNLREICDGADLRFLCKLNTKVKVSGGTSDDNRRVKDFLENGIIKKSCGLGYVNYCTQGIDRSEYSKERGCQVIKLYFAGVSIYGRLSSVPSNTRFDFAMTGDRLAPDVVMNAGSFKFSPTPFGVVIYGTHEPVIYEGLDKIYYDYSDEEVE